MSVTIHCSSRHVILLCLGVYAGIGKGSASAVWCKGLALADFWAS